MADMKTNQLQRDNAKKLKKGRNVAKAPINQLYSLLTIFDSHDKFLTKLNELFFKAVKYVFRSKNNLNFRSYLSSNAQERIFIAI